MASTEADSLKQKGDAQNIDPRICRMRVFRLFSTESKFYMIGSSQSGKSWRVLKIDRMDPSKLNISEDPVIYSYEECCDLVERIHAGNRSTGGMKFITICYGIVGFFKFLGPYYMLIITKRRQIGAICGHKIYAIDKIELITITNSTVQSNVVYSKDENRYKKLLCSVDLRNGFFFSYSYNVMCSLQKNFCNVEKGTASYNTMFVWNEFLTRGIRNQLKNIHWTVALVYGFFEQCKLSISGKNFQLALIARRSRHYAGTRYLKRGVNDKGRVANDVETEQIVFEDVSEGYPVQISSVVQNRGSIPLFWSQDDASPLNFNPEIILHSQARNYAATRLHFEDLVKRYGNPIIILNLIKACEKKPRESILGAEFASAIEFLNKDLPEDNQLKFFHWDLSKHHEISTAAEVFPLMDKVATYALNLTGFLYCQVTPNFKYKDTLKCPEKEHTGINSQNSCNYSMVNNGLETEIQEDTDKVNKNYLIKFFVLQKGVLRTNCIDCLDRTNVAQCEYGWAALLHQLHAFGYIDAPEDDPNGPLANNLTRIYERMGDSLAIQYGGSAAQNKLFREKRGEWKPAIQSLCMFRTFQRYCNNVYMDAHKQNAINLFLGHFQPQQGKPAIWELDSDQHYNANMHAFNFPDVNGRTCKRSQSDANVLHERNETEPVTSDDDTELPISTSPDGILQDGGNRYNFLRNLLQQSDKMHGDGSRGSHSFYSKNLGIGNSNFLDLEWLMSSGNSSETNERSPSLSNSPSSSVLLDNAISDVNDETTPGPSPLSRKYLSIMKVCTYDNHLKNSSLQQSFLFDGLHNKWFSPFLSSTTLTTSKRCRFSDFYKCVIQTNHLTPLDEKLPKKSLIIYMNSILAGTLNDLESAAKPSSTHLQFILQKPSKSTQGHLRSTFVHLDYYKLSSVTIFQFREAFCANADHFFMGEKLQIDTLTL